MFSTSMPLTQHHPRHFHSFQYVYPVISRRANGLSIGINLHSPCNFSCLYCQVLADSDRPESETLDLVLLESELQKVLEIAQSGKLFEEDWFRQTPIEKRRLNDIALSGDGEPTLAKQFGEVVQLAAKVRAECCPATTKLVLITNATAFHVKHVAESVDLLMQHGGEIWAKLDAGSATFYTTIARSTVPYESILQNITNVAIQYPVVIQTIVFTLNGSILPVEELNAYINRLNTIVQQGGRIKMVQLYTVARTPPQTGVLPLSNTEMDQLSDEVRRKTSLLVQAYYSK